MILGRCTGGGNGVGMWSGLTMYSDSLSIWCCSTCSIFLLRQFLPLIMESRGWNWKEVGAGGRWKGEVKTTSFH